MKRTMGFALLVAGLVGTAAASEGNALSLDPGVQLDGVWLDAGAARSRGLVVTECISGDVRRVSLENRSPASVFPEELGWRKSGSDDFDVCGLKVYLESWQMSSPCGVRNWDDEPFGYSDDYLVNCVSTPVDFHRGEKGRFLSDHQCCFRRPDGKMRLYGFTTGKDRFGHFRMKLAKDGIGELYALCACDRAELKPGERIVSEKLVTMDGEDTEALFAAYASRWASDSNARHRFVAPVGWCSWYYYFDKVTLADVIENADWLKDHREAGFERVKVIQLDDGYQRKLGDWLVPNEKFPGGLRRFAEEVKARGFTPAVWVGPFMVEEGSDILKAHPDWMVKGVDGNPAVSFGWREGHKVYSLDGTNPAVQEHLRTLFRTLRGYGIDYVKLDFCMLASSIPNARYFDRTATRAQALRRAFEAIREGFGDDGFILGCTAPFGPLVGIVDAMRSSTDITPYWQNSEHPCAESPTVPNVCRNVISHNYMNGRVWINDPDTLIVRDDHTELTKAEVCLWAEAVARVGGSLLLSDRLSTLSAVRLEIVKDILRRSGSYASTFPVDRWERTCPTVWRSVRDGRRSTATFDFDKSHSVACAGATGFWREEAGIRKFAVGRSPDIAHAQERAAYEKPIGCRTHLIDETMTLDDVNDIDLLPGDRVLFKRGGVWRGQLQARSGKPGHPIFYGAYGEGPKPVIQTSYARNRTDDWRKTMVDGKELWMAETGAAADIGNIVFELGAKGCAFKKCFVADVKDEFDYWCDPKTFAVYLKCDGNPASRFTSIELCEKVHCVEQGFMHDIDYDGLSLRLTGAHAFAGGDVKRISIRNCDISWIGGGYLYYDKKGNGVRFGNGIEFWANCEDCIVEGNRLWEIWDAALTNQSNEDGAVQKNIVWRGNEVWNSEYSYEYWQQGADARTENVRVENNIFRDAGKGWGHRQRWNPNAAHLMFYDTTAETKDFVVKGNVFSRSEDCLFRFFNDWRANLEMVDNKWVAEKEPICRYHGRPTKDLVYKYPDRLDQMHDDNLAEIQSQGSGARVFKADERDAFVEFIGERSAQSKGEGVFWQDEIDRVAASGGGRVVIPAGRHLTGGLVLRSNVELHLEKGAVLVGSSRTNDYTQVDLPYSEGRWMALVMALDAENVSVTGEGILFGNGTAWPQPVSGCQEGTRPRGLFFANCRNVRLSDFTLRDAACWGIVLKDCDGLVARRVKVDSHSNCNNDGFDLEAKNVLLEDCDVDTGDDAFCIKSNNPDFIVENVTIRRCVARSNCSFFKIGTASHGVVRNVCVEGFRTEAPRRSFVASIDKADWGHPKKGEEWFWFNRTHERVNGPEHLAGMNGIAIECVDGGEVRDVTLRNLDLKGCMVPFFVRGGMRTGRSIGTPPGTRHILRNILIENARAEAESSVASSITGVAGCRPCDIALRNVIVTCKGAGDNSHERDRVVPEVAGNYPEGNMFRCMLRAYGLYVRHADNVRLENVNFTLREGTSDRRDPVVWEDADVR